MTEEDYQKGIKEYDDEINVIMEKRNNFKKAYAMLNNTVKIGDFVESNLEPLVILKVTKIDFDLRKSPECVYYGQRYTIKENPYKSGEMAGLSQSCVKKHTVVD